MFHRDSIYRFEKLIEFDDTKGVLVQKRKSILLEGWKPRENAIKP